MVPEFKNVGERPTAKNYRPVILLFVLSKVIEKLVNNRIVDDLEKSGFFSDFQYSFRSSRSTSDLLTVVSDRISRAFNRSGATRAVTPDISTAFDRVWYSIAITLVDDHLNWLNWFHFLILEKDLLVILIDYMIFLSPFLYVIRMSMPIVSFLAQLDSGILCL